MGELVRDVPMSGSIPYAVGQASVVRIPIPGSDGLCIEFRPRFPGDWRPRDGTTSTLFFQDIEGKRQLRLDYGERRLTPTTTTIDYHWNQEGTHRQFGITSHTPVGSGGRAAYHAAKYFRYAGGVLVVAGVAIDIVSIVRASSPLRRASQVVASWAGAWIGCKAGGAGGAVIGTAASPIGTAVGGTAGCIIGGFGGYVGASTLAGGVFDWAEGTFFTPLPQVNPP